MVTEAQKAAAEAYKTRIASENADAEQLKEETPTQRGRTFLQGLTFGTADELEAYIRSLTSERDYEDLVNEIRGNLDAYKQARPLEAAGAEIGGALAPVVIATFLTGGGALPAVAARFPFINSLVGRVTGKLLGTRGTQSVSGGIVVGGGQGGLTGFGTAEGDVTERIDETLTGTGTGLLFGAGGEVASKVIGKSLGSLLDYARRQFGSRASGAVEREIQRLAKEREITPEQAYQEVLEGRILAENRTLRDIVRTYRATGGEAATILQKELLQRPNVTRKDVVDYLESSLGVTQKNILEQQTNRLATLKDDAEKLYETDAFNNNVPQEFTNTLASIFTRVPRAFDEVKEALQARGEKMFFKIDDNGNLKITGQPTIGQAERVRRAINNRVKTLFDAGQGDAAKALKAVELELRNIIDNISPDTKAARKQYSELMSENDAFKNAQKLYTTNPDFDMLQSEWDKVIAQGDAQIKAFRLGVMSKLRRMLSGSQSAATIKKLLDENNSMNQSLSEIFPEQNLEEMLKRLSVAKEANDTANQVLGQSQTAITNALIERQRGSDLLDAGLDIATGGSAIFGISRLLMRMLKKAEPEFSDAQRKEIVQIMVSRDADRIKNILNDESWRAVLQDYLTTTSSAILRGGQRASIQMQAQNEEFLPSMMDMLRSSPQ